MVRRELEVRSTKVIADIAYNHCPKSMDRAATILQQEPYKK